MEDKNGVPELPAKDVDVNEESQEYGKRGCCFWIPCFGFAGGSSVRTWELISTSENPKDETTSSWLSKSVEAVKKVREWSEVVAGPKWKTFIRRFNKNRSKTGKFQYDPLSYALNFDNGPDHNGDWEDSVAYPDFSSRYASSMDLGKNATATFT
ncbi:PREDICTED: uncharacterized protein LOC109158099 [Ipomoea nil]|uniref:uncharacterized protein LOC109158099 n=1 Tax=Ipomoea nil TaxID=35883 RepID=UPI00090154D4|nr:PREDICTED: uncharacterized protein LOC109158099 [Ipomoea nil]